ncbi:MAG: DUF6282 family protein [Dehalococcoidia bacterium]|jgi:hypothetical protein|nr:DUF6282 family protein [Dehalococcoidia bacterium]
MQEEVFEASLSDEMLRRIRGSSVVSGQAGGTSFYSPLERSFEAQKRWMTSPAFKVDRVWELLRGTYDVHQHSGPSPHTERLFDELDLAIHGCYIGLGGIVFKEQFMPSTRSARIVQKVVDQWADEHGRQRIEIFGGVCLNYAVGGLNPDAVIASYRMGGKYVWLPNVDSNHHRLVVNEGVGQGIDLVDGDGNVVPKAREILDLISQTDMVLGIGHQSTKERLALVKEAVRLGIKRIEITHVNYPPSWLTPEQCRTFADLGAFISIYAIDDSYYSWDDVMAVYRAVGPERMLIASDRGHISLGHPIDGLRRLIVGFIQSGVPDEHIRLMCQANPYSLLH